MLETICIFEAANFVLWNALRLWLGPFPSYVVNEIYSLVFVKLWGSARNQKTTRTHPFVCFQLRHYCLPLRNMLECSKYVYIVENLPSLGLSLTHIFTK